MEVKISWVLVIVNNIEMPCRGDSDSAIRHQEALQEEVAQDMVAMARSLKDNSLAAKRVISSDNEVSKGGLSQEIVQQ